MTVTNTITINRITIAIAPTFAQSLRALLKRLQVRPWSASRDKKMHRFLAATESCLCQIMVVSVVLAKCWSGFLSQCSPCQLLVWFRVTVQTLSSAGLVSCHSADLQPCQCKSHALLVVVGINPVMVRTAVSCHGHSASSRVSSITEIQQIHEQGWFLDIIINVLTYSLCTRNYTQRVRTYLGISVSLYMYTICQRMYAVTYVIMYVYARMHVLQVCLYVGRKAYVVR